MRSGATASGLAWADLDAARSRSAGPAAAQLPLRRWPARAACRRDLGGDRGRPRGPAPTPCAGSSRRAPGRGSRRAAAARPRRSARPRPGHSRHRPGRADDRRIVVGVHLEPGLQHRRELGRQPVGRVACGCAAAVIGGVVTTGELGRARPLVEAGAVGDLVLDPGDQVGQRFLALVVVSARRSRRAPGRGSCRRRRGCRRS